MLKKEIQRRNKDYRCHKEEFAQAMQDQLPRLMQEVDHQWDSEPLRKSSALSIVWRRSWCRSSSVEIISIAIF